MLAGGGGGDILSGWRGTNAGSMYAPKTTNELSDETIVGKVYDNRVVRRLLTYIRPYKKDAMISLVAVIFFGVTLLHFGSNYLQSVAIARVGQGVLYSMRTQLFNHLQSLSPAFFHRTSVGRIMSRSQSDVLQLQETFELLVTTLADILSLAGIIVAMLVTYWQRFARHSFMRIRRAIAMVNGEYNQNITGVRVVQSLNRQHENLKHFNGLNQELLDANLEASRFSGSLQPIVEC